MKCVVCDQRKGKRYCPANNAGICPQCCGEKRVLEISCPDNCEYLKSGRKREMQEYRRRFRSMDQSDRERNMRVLDGHHQIVADMEDFLSRERLTSRDLTDKAVSEAVRLLLEGYRTEEKGIIYEESSDDAEVEYLRRELRKIIESYRNPGGRAGEGIVDPQQTRLQLREAIECLEYVRSMLVTYLEERSSSTGYVDLLARISEKKDVRSSIIIP